MYIVLDKSDKYRRIINVVTDKKNKKLTKFFETIEEAQKFAYEDCMDALAVNIGD